MRTITLITLALTLGCSGKTENAVSSPGADGAEGAEGEAGPPGEDGAPGEDGLDCWDLNGDGEANPEEDINGDGVVDVVGANMGMVQALLLCGRAAEVSPPLRS